MKWFKRSSSTVNLCIIRDGWNITKTRRTLAVCYLITDNLFWTSNIDDLRGKGNMSLIYPTHLFFNSNFRYLSWIRQNQTELFIIKTVLLWGENRHFSIIFASHGSSCFSPPPPPNPIQFELAGDIPLRSLYLKRDLAYNRSHSSLIHHNSRKQ